MSDTVRASVIVASLADAGPSFVLGARASDAAADVVADTNGFHVSGATNATEVSGFGSPLLLDFVTWYPVPMSMETATSVSGAGPGGIVHDNAPGIPGALYATFDHLA
jgi:hypothetical protein